MAKELAQFIANKETKDALAEVHGGIIENIQANLISSNVKNTNYSGEIEAGSVRIARFANAESKAYGTARTAGKGIETNNKGEVIINLDTHREIVEEFNLNDLKTHDIKDLVARRAVNQESALGRELERAFFTAAEKEATEVDLTGLTEIVDQIDAVITSVATTQNDFVDGVEKEHLALILSPQARKLLKNHIVSTPQGHVTTDNAVIGKYDGVDVYENMRQTADIIVMLKGSVGQPVNIYYYDIEKIPLSNNHALQLFYDYGTGVITPDLIKKATFKAEDPVVDPDPENGDPETGDPDPETGDPDENGDPDPENP